MSSTVCQSHKFQFIEQNKLTPTDSVGVISLFSVVQFLLLRVAEDVDPYNFCQLPYEKSAFYHKCFSIQAIMNWVALSAFPLLFS